MAKKISHPKYALLSVSDKTGIVEFAKALDEKGYRIISTGGTAKALTANDIPVIPIQEVTGNPESFDGRMKTISFQIESGILFDRENPKHVKEAISLGIKPIDLVVCNLYPFERTIADPKVKLKNAIENIDVGGPTMIRAAAKNFKHAIVVVDPHDYQNITSLLATGIPEKKRRALAAKAFAHLSLYDAQIAGFLSDTSFPKEITIPGRKMIDLRYGENPHQAGALYAIPNTNAPVTKLLKKWGRDLSLTNASDINAGIESVRLFTEPAAVIIKHNSPCGIALGRTGEEALVRAIDADPESAFGGVIVTNCPIDKRTAAVIGRFKDQRRSNIDILAGTNITNDALSYLQTVRKSMGIYVFGKIPKHKTDSLTLKWVDGGFMLQTGDDAIGEGFVDWKVVTRKKPTAKQSEQMHIAWKFISKIRSNAVIVVDEILPMTRGIGSGQTSRLRSTTIALTQAKTYAKNAILASDSFFPFDDSVKLAAKHGIKAIVQQGGSINDRQSIDAADKAGLVMIFTGQRAFWH